MDCAKQSPRESRLGRRSRKRSAIGAPEARVAPSAGGSGPAAAGSERTDGDRTRAQGAPKHDPSNGSLKRGYARGRARDDAIRAQLQPLAPGARPGAVTVAAFVAAALGVANIALYAVGVDVRGTKPGAGGVILFAALMFAAAAGMWRARYWAVLGFEALLGITIVIAALSLAVASNVAAVVLCLAIAGAGGLLFWKLVRAMARIQMPRRETGR